jgi:hypothetical protein
VTPSILGGLHGMRAAGTASFGVLVSPPSPGNDRPVYRPLQFLFKDPVRHRSPRGGLCWQLISDCIVGMRNMLQVQDLKVLLKLLHLEQVGGQLWIIVAAFSLDLLDDLLRITFH